MRSRLLDKISIMNKKISSKMYKRNKRLTHRRLLTIFLEKYTQNGTNRSRWSRQKAKKG